jgi:hypothetical protein
MNIGARRVVVSIVRVEKRSSQIRENTKRPLKTLFKTKSIHQAKGHAPTTRCPSSCGGYSRLPPLVSTQRAQQALNTNKSLLHRWHHGIREPDYTYHKGGTALFTTPGGAYAHPDRRRHTMGRNGAAPGRRLAATALPHLLPVLPVRAPSTSTSALCYRLLGSIIGNKTILYKFFP